MNMVSGPIDNMVTCSIRAGEQLTIALATILSVERQSRFVISLYRERVCST